MLAVTQLVKEVRDYRELLWALTCRDIRVKYKQAVMGILWAFFLPVLAIFSGIIVQAAIVYIGNAGKPPDQQQVLDWNRIVSIIMRTLPWSLFVGILNSTANGLLGGMSLAAKIYFPRQIIPLSNTLTATFDFAISAVLVALLLLVLPASPVVGSWHLLLIPVLLGMLIVMALGLGLIFGTANIFFRDAKYILSVLIQFGIFFTPVLLFMDQYPRRLAHVMIWNPVAPVLEALARIVNKGTLALPAGSTPVESAWLDNLWPYLGYSAAVTVAAVLLGVVIFRRSEHLFAERM